MHHRSPHQRTLSGLLAVMLAAAGTVVALATPAAAAPVVYDTGAEKVTYSNDVVITGQTFTVTVEEALSVHLNSVTLSARLLGTQWTYVGCTPTGGNVTGCSYSSGGGTRLDFSAGNSVGSAVFTFSVNPGATGTLPYNGILYKTPDLSGGTQNYSGALTIADPEADIAVTVTGAPHLGILVPALTFTLTATNNGPDPVTAATLTATIPSGITATNLSSGCTQSGTSISCDYGTIANSANAAKSFRLPLSLLSLGAVTVTAVRTSSTPDDPNAANDTGSDTCHVISIIFATC